MYTLPNFLSFLRIPFALLFFYPSINFKVLLILLAGFTDFLDGFLARKFSQTSRFGTVLDPITDKFFVMTVLSFFYFNNQISSFEICAMLCRDFSVILFGFYLLTTKNFSKYHFRSIWSGKLSTTIQLLVLMLLTLNQKIPQYMYFIFIVLGLTALIELYFSDHSFIPIELKRSKKNQKNEKNEILRSDISNY